jgi:hypothetical protein
MASWREVQSSSVIEGQVVTGEVQPPARYAVRGFSVLPNFIRVLLFFVLRTFRPLVRILLGLIAGFTLLGCVISFAAAWYQNWPAKFLWTSGGMLAVSITCSMFLWYYDMLILRLTPQGVDMVLFN